MILSICIPTYNNPDILLENIVLIKKQLSKFQGDFEIVIGENFSNAENRKKILNVYSDSIRFILHESNIGFGSNLFKTMIEANGKYILLLGDDDFPKSSILTELIIYLKEKKDSKLFFLPLNTTPNPTILKSRSILPWVFMRSGSMMGIVFKKQSCAFDSSKFNQALYPQIDLAMEYVVKHGFTSKFFANFIIVGQVASLSEKINDKMERPRDYGIIEKCEIILRLHSKSKIDYLTTCRCLRGLFLWVINYYFKLKRENKVKAKKFIKSFDYVFFLKFKKYLIITIFLLINAMRIKMIKNLLKHLHLL